MNYLFKKLNFFFEKFKPYINVDKLIEDDLQNSEAKHQKRL